MTTYKFVKEKRNDYHFLYEAAIAGLYNKFHRSGFSMIDGGANTGLHSLPMAKLIKNENSLSDDKSCKLFAIEAIPYISDKLSVNFDLAGVTEHVILINKAVSNTSGITNFVVNDANPGISGLANFVSNTEGTRIIQVPLTRIDDEINVPVDFIKLDLEGVEFQSLQGSTKLLSAYKPLIVFENGLHWSSVLGGYSHDVFFDFFKSFGYEVINIHAESIHKSNFDTDIVGFEFIATQCNTLDEIKSYLTLFWTKALKMPKLTDWSQAVDLVNNVLQLTDS